MSLTMQEFFHKAKSKSWKTKFRFFREKPTLISSYLGSGNQQTIADAFFDSGNFGFGRLASGLIYYIDMNQRYLYVSTAGEMITVFEDYINDSIEACTDFMANEDYKDAVLEMIDWAKKAVAEADSNAQAPTKP